MQQLFADFTLVDGTGRDPIEHAVMLLDADRIQWVGPLVDLPGNVDRSQAIDLAGRTVIPGIIDAHIHVCWNGRQPIQELLYLDRDDLLLDAVQTVGNVLKSGTTTVRDIGGHYHMEMALRRAIDSGRIAGPRMRTSGRILCMTGGHGHFIAHEVDGPDEFRKAARAQIKAGAETIKMMATGGVATPGQDIQASQLTVEEMAAAVEVAHTMGRTAATHCHGAGGIKNSLLAGVDTIEHCSFLEEEAAEMMLAQGSAAVFTLSVGKPLMESLAPELREAAKTQRQKLAWLDERVHRSVALAREKGVLIGCGTDAGGNELTPHDFSMARELEEFVAHGFTPLEALTIATRNNAQILRWDDQLGTLEKGKLADFVVLGADPLENVANVRQIEAVYKGGELV
ncbi:MAG: amidohydrolase family protein [Chloroflexota bacterium]